MRALRVFWVDPIRWDFPAYLCYRWCAWQRFRHTRRCSPEPMERQAMQSCGPPRLLYRTALGEIQLRRHNGRSFVALHNKRASGILSAFYFCCGLLAENLYNVISFSPIPFFFPLELVGTLGFFIYRTWGERIGVMRELWLCSAYKWYVRNQETFWFWVLIAPHFLPRYLDTTRCPALVAFASSLILHALNYAVVAE